MMGHHGHARVAQATRSPRLRSHAARLDKRSAFAAAVFALCSACAPTLDWRTVALPEGDLSAELPCRPGRFQRDVVVAGVSLRLFMLSCEAGGVTYGIASADVGDPTRIEAVLAALREGAQASIRARPARVEAVELRGATPFLGNASLRLQGSRPDGRAVEQSLQVFGRGTRVFEASAIGTRLDDVSVEPFRHGLHFQLEKPVTDPR